MGIEQFRYDGRRVLVAGGASGMGAAVARLVADLGGDVVVADIAPAEPGIAKSVHVDLRDRASIDAAVDEIGGPVHSLFSCAGVSGAPFSPVDVMLVNFVGARHLVERVEDLMPAGSSIAFISSIGGLGWERRITEIAGLLAASDFDAATAWCRAHADAPPGTDPETIDAQAAANYVLSKQAIDVYVQRRAVELARRGLRINATAPGPTATPLMDRTPAWQMFGTAFFEQAMAHPAATPDEQAAPLVFLNSAAAAHVNGQILSVDLGYTAGGLMGVVDCPLVEPLLPRE
jgi:NAD(P)-dependent dehydrogenase (short-subunit alcohol dehydrogenase family)